LSKRYKNKMKEDASKRWQEWVVEKCKYIKIEAKCE